VWASIRTREVGLEAVRASIRTGEVGLEAVGASIRTREVGLEAVWASIRTREVGLNEARPPGAGHSAPLERELNGRVSCPVLPSDLSSNTLEFACYPEQD